MKISAEQFAKLQLRKGAAPVTREADLHELIGRELKARRIYFVHSRMDRASTNGIGTTDFIIALPQGRTLWIEAKTAKGKQTREQAGVELLLRIAGHRHAVVRSFKEFTDAMEKAEV
jgi:hypothetical protein